MENSNIIAIEEKEKEDARALTQSFARSDVKSRAYINALGAEILLKYFEKENIIKERTYNLHNIRKILEEFDISDVKLSNIHIDVRVVFDENQIFIPKSHFEYDLLPDIYVVFKLAKDHSNVEFLGFFEPKLINKNNANDKYYFIEKEKLSSPVDLKSFVENFKGDRAKDYSQEELDNAEFLMLSMTDHDVSDEDKRKLLNYLSHSEVLRDEFIEYENFEMISYQAANIVGLELPVNPSDVNIAEIPTEDMPSDIADEIMPESSEPEIVEESNSDNNGGVSGLVEGAVTLGAEIAGTAMASAALAGTEEAVDTTANIVNAAANVANVTSDAIDMANSIQNMAAQVFSDDNAQETTQDLENLNLDNLANEVDFSNVENSLSDDAAQSVTDTVAEPNWQDVQSDVASDNSEDVQSESQVEDTVAEAQDSSDSDNMNGSLDELFADYGNDSSDESNTSEQNNDDYEDDYEDDYVENSFSGSDLPSSRGSLVDSIARGLHTPISEATELTSLEDIQSGNIPKASAPANTGDIMETMEMDEFHNLVNNYVPQEIKDESETVAFDNVGGSSAIPISANKEEQAEDASELSTMDDIASETTNNDGSDINDRWAGAAEGVGSVLPKAEGEELTSDAFVEDLSDIQNTSDISKPADESDVVAETVENAENISDTQDLSHVLDHADELTSDDFVQNMPDVQDLSHVLDHADELTSDDFVQNMPDVQDLSNVLDHADELTSDDFVQNMPEEQDLSNALDHADELTSDDFVQNMPEEQDLSNALDHADELTTDDLVEDLSEMQNVTGTADLNDSANIADNTAHTEDTDLDEGFLSQLDSIGLGELPEENTSSDEIPDDQISDLISGESSPNDEEKSVSGLEVSDETAEITDSEKEQDDEKLHVLYDGSTADNIESLESEPNENQEEENYDFRPDNKFGKLMPVFAILAAIIIAGSVVGFLIKSKNSVDADTLIQTTEENEMLASPEVDNSNILGNNGPIPTANIPKDGETAAPQAQTKAPSNQPAASTPAPAKATDKKEVKPAAQKAPVVRQVTPTKPLNSSKTITLRKLAWQVPDYLSYSDNMKRYLQTAGKSIKLTLSSDLLLTNDYIYSNQVKVDLKLNKNGDIISSKIAKSSGSEQVDKIVLRTVKDTLNVVKPAQGEVPTPNYNLALIIYL